MLLHPMPHAKIPCRNYTTDSPPTVAPARVPGGKLPLEQCMVDKVIDREMMSMLTNYDGSDDVVLWEARDVTLGDWKEGQIVYSYNNPHAVSILFIVINVYYYCCAFNRGYFLEKFT